MQVHEELALMVSGVMAVPPMPKNAHSRTQRMPKRMVFNIYIYI